MQKKDIITGIIGFLSNQEKIFTYLKLLYNSDYQLNKVLPHRVEPSHGGFRWGYLFRLIGRRHSFGRPASLFGCVVKQILNVTVDASTFSILYLNFAAEMDKKLRCLASD
jgi:hypothetical protein